MEIIRYSVQLLDYYRPVRRVRWPGWPLKSLLRGYNREGETGHLFA